MKDSKTLLFAIGAPFCFGTGFTLAKPASSHFPPLLMLLFAYGFIAILTAYTVPGKPKTPWIKGFIIAACSVTIQGALLFWAVRDMESTTANLLLQTQVPAAVFLGWWLLQEKLTFQKLVGTALALFGAAIIIGMPQQKPPLVPVIFVVTSGIVWSLGQVFVRKWSVDDGAMTLKANALYGVPQLIFATLLLEQGHWQSIVTATPLQWATLAFVVIVGFYIAYICWFNLLRRVGIDEAAPWILLMTPIGLVTAVLLLGEHMTAVQITGACVLMAGLAIVSGVPKAITRWGSAG